nr:hypothetical protein CFP56_23064 [Quercus suber]
MEEEELIPQVVAWDKPLWKGVGALQSPRKVKSLLWRAYRNAIPTKENLVHQMALENPICDRCNGSMDNSLHALWSCSELDVVWFDPVLWSFKHTHRCVDFKELLSWIIQQDKNSELFAMRVW